MIPGRWGGVLLSLRVRPDNYGFQGKMCGGHDTAIFTMLYLKVLFTVWFQNIFKLIFLKQQSWPKTVYAKHWRKLALTTFLGSFLILIVQQFCVALTNSCLLEHATVFPIKNKFPHWTGYFEFLFWISSAILLSKMKSLFLNFSASPQWVTWLLQLLITARSVY